MVPPSEADIIFNRANVALAKSQRLVASWLPPRTEEEIKNTKSEEEIEREEQEMFTPVPEVLGLGAKTPEDVREWDLKRQKPDSNDQLRRQLLGQNHARIHKPRPQPAERKSQDESEDDSECGRSSLGKAKRRMHNQGGEEGSLHIGKSKKLTTDHGDLARAAKRSSNYLDEVLAQREEKKRKKKH
ncbi:MAG: hypothetical protein Q9190_007570 [Brigantiaea leucoxantha]